MKQITLLLLPVLLCVLLSSCQSTGPWEVFGYAVGPRHDTNIRTIRVPIFRNATFIRDVEFELTEAVCKRIEAATPWKIVRTGAADAELTGTVIALAKRPILQNGLNEVRDAELTLATEVIFHDTRTGANLFDPAKPSPQAPPGLIDPMTMPKPVMPKPVLVRSSASYIPEIGQSNATARQKIVDELAVKIVNLMECPW
jgi:hypothetical protein